MGALAHFDIPGLQRRHGLVSFVETGTASGESLARAASAPFQTLFSIEIVPELVQAARARFAGDPRIRIWEGDSADLLPAMLSVLPAGPCLFWLDAHFPGAHAGAEYDAEPSLAKRLPLEAEVSAIARQRRGARDILLIDDARIYQTGPYGAGDLPADWAPIAGVKRSLDFVRAAFGRTHGVVVDYSDQGYVMVCPRAERKAA
jgi:hypothetical protein